MCVIASLPRGKNITNKSLDQMWMRNPDGGGIAWIQDGKIQVYKTMKLKEFKRKFKEVTSKYGDSDILVHMRIATHGSVCIDNNHPFHVDTQTVFAHNGIMPIEFHPPAKSDLSDTRYFNKVLLQNMKPVALDDDLFRTALGDIIGGGNKLVILSANKKLKQDSYIINEHIGQWVKGVWYSNTAHVPSTYKGIKFDKTGSVVTQTQDALPFDDLGFVPDSCDISDEYYLFDEVDEMELYSTMIPLEDMSDAKVIQQIDNFAEAASRMYIYDTFDDLMADLAIDYRDGNFYCVDCKKQVKAIDGGIKRACAPTCSCFEFAL